MSKNDDLKNALVDIATPDPFVSMVENLATNEAVDADKLEKLVDVQLKVMAENARREFYVAFANMQEDIPVIEKDGKIIVSGEVRSQYASNEAIQTVVKPILKAHGFLLTFRNEYPDDKTLQVVGTLAHRAGHFIESDFKAPADTSGSKNVIQAYASTQSYGQRYVTKGLLNIVEKGVDDDGNALPDAPLTEDEQNAVHAKAVELFGEDRVPRLLDNLAKQYFGIDDSDWHKIPSYRVGDAIRKLEEKASES